MTRSRLVLALLLGFLTMVLAIEESSSALSYEVEGATAEQGLMAERAVERFEAAGLSLPTVVIEFVGPSLDECGGARARAHLDRDPFVVSVCWGDPYVLLHELAHVWTHRGVSQEQETAFMRMRTGVREWANSSDAWEEQGREHAANIIAWGLMENPRVVSRTYPNDRASLIAEFMGLTGVAPAHVSGGEPVFVDRAAFSEEPAGSVESGR